MKNKKSEGIIFITIQHFLNFGGERRVFITYYAKKILPPSQNDCLISTAHCDPRWSNICLFN